MSNLPEDVAILKDLLSGDRKSARIFLEKYGGLIRYAIRSVRVKSDVVGEEDVFNGTIAHLLDNDCRVLRIYAGKCLLTSYLYTVCRRYALDMARKENKLTGQTESVDLETVPAEIIEEEICYDGAVKNAFKAVFDALDVKDQLFIKMLFYDKRSTEEIMQFFNYGSENSVYSRKNKLIVKLRKLVKKYSNKR